MQDDSQWVAIAVTAGFFVVFAAIALLLRRRRRLTPRPPDDGTGITGWLALLALGVTLLPVKLAVSFFAGFTDVDAIRAVPNGMAVLWTESAAIAGLLFLSVAVAAAFWRKQVAFKRLFIVLWALLLAFALLDPFFVSNLFGVPLAAVFDKDAIRNIFGNVVTVAWVLYVLRSTRVARTFIR